MMDVVGSERGAPEASGLGSDQPVTAREAVEKMVRAGMLDDLMNQVDSGELQLTGDGGLKVKESHAVRNKAAHIAVGVDTDGIKHVLGIWVQASEGAKFWLGVLAELRNRGLADVLI